MKIGVLALQGNFAEHLSVLGKMGAEAFAIRTIDELNDVNRLIIPGGESTTISKLLKTSGLFKVIKERNLDGSLPLLGTCAGIIMLATRVNGNVVPETLGLMDITVERNAYGTQVDSFKTEVEIKGISEGVSASFIRAPIISKIGPNVEVLAEVEGNPVLIKEASCLAATFHTEVHNEPLLHKLLLDI